jgi:hypothetical protein
LEGLLEQSGAEVDGYDAGACRIERGTGPPEMALCLGEAGREMARAWKGIKVS